MSRSRKVERLMIREFFGILLIINIDRELLFIVKGKLNKEDQNWLLWKNKTFKQ